MPDAGGTKPKKMRSGDWFGRQDRDGSTSQPDEEPGAAESPVRRPPVIGICNLVGASGDYVPRESH